MTPEYVRLKKEMNVRQALDAIRRQGENAETVYINYVVERNRLKGVVSARDLIVRFVFGLIFREREQKSGAVSAAAE